MKCSFCDGNSIHHRRNEGHYYCEEHLIKSIEKRVRKTIRNNDLIKNDDRILVALSGGKDSSSVLLLLKNIFQKNPKMKIEAITIDPGIEETQEGIKKASDFCRKLGIKRHLFSFSEEFGVSLEEVVESNENLGYCEICGVFRRYLINKKAREMGFDKVVTGHNLDDEAQSILMNVMKGDMMRLARVGPKPMISGNPKFVPRIKPLINVPEKEIVLFARINEIKHYKKQCPFRRYNNLRGETIKYLNALEKSSPGLKHSLLNSALRLKPHIEKEFEKTEIKLCEKCKEPTSRKICKTCKVLGGVLS